MLLLIFYVLNTVSLGLGGWTYHLVDIVGDWYDAQIYCRHHFTDLAIIHTEEDAEIVNALISFDNVYPWVGMYKNFDGNWQWMDGTLFIPDVLGNASYYYDNYDCAHVAPHYKLKWATDECIFTNRPAVCYKENTTAQTTTISSTGGDHNTPAGRTYNLVQNDGDWYESRTYCRTWFTDLAIIRTEEDAQTVNALLKMYNVFAWVGMYQNMYGKWQWMDGTLFTPDVLGNATYHYYDNEYCAYVAPSTKLIWGTDDCTYIYRSTLCYEENKAAENTTISSTGGDKNTPAVQLSSSPLASTAAIAPLTTQHPQTNALQSSENKTAETTTISSTRGDHNTLAVQLGSSPLASTAAIAPLTTQHPQTNALQGSATKKVIVRVNLEALKEVDFKDPRVRDPVLAQIIKLLSKHGPMTDSTVGWVERVGGIVHRRTEC